MKKKNLLFISHRVPYPPNKGDKIRSFNILKHLSKKYNIYLACMIDDKRDITASQNLHTFISGFYFDIINPFWKKIFSITAFLRSLPISVYYFYSNSVQQSIDSLLEKQHMDVIFCYSSPTAEYIFSSKHYSKLQQSLWIMDFIDLDSYKWLQYSKASSFPMSVIYRLEAKFLRRYEKRVSKEFQHIFITTEAEKALFLQQVSLEANITPLQNGVDFHYFSPNHQTSIEKNEVYSLIFAGVMDYFPNIDGVKWFAEDIFPLILKKIPSVTFYIVGSNPTEDVKQLGQRPKITVTGFVDDVRDYYSIADVCIVPLRIARGIQNKVLEGMAMSKPTVCTPQALVGIEKTSKNELFVAESEKSFADSVVSLLQNKLLMQEMGMQARKFVRNNYSWEGNLQKLDSILSLYQ
ncbi:MAG: TIGR03087 family PEP-CTERM/XrtA system glycosyltransferase [Thermodesulfobacteriota bacterium]